MGGRVAGVAGAPTGLRFLAAGFLAIRFPATALAVADSHVWPEPPPADPARSLPGIGHARSSSPASPGQLLASTGGSVLASAEGNAPLTYNPIIEDKPACDIRPETPRTKQTSNYGAHGLVSKRKIPIDKKLPTSVVRFANEQKTIHPTQKPVALFEYLIRTYTNPDELVLDNCMGTAIACLNTDRKFVGFELDPDYFAKASERIEQHLSKNELPQTESDLGGRPTIASFDDLFEAA